MKPVFDSNFLLTTETAQKLYHQYAAPMPIVDYHCHIDPKDIAEDRVYENIAQVWLGGDHYKWRLMRANGVEEKFITGHASDREKFQKFAEVMHKAAGSPVYQWAHMELKTYFDYQGELNGETAQEVWELCAQKLQTMSVRQMIARCRVETVVTTDDPIDSLHWHEVIAADKSCQVQVFPAWRPDKAMNIHKEGFSAYIAMLSQSAGIQIRDLDSLFAALSRRMDHFAAHGCPAADHGLERTPIPADREEAERILASALSGEKVSEADASRYQYVVLRYLAGEYCRRGWVMQLHLCATYGLNRIMQKKLGPDTGYDGIGAACSIPYLAEFFNSLVEENCLGKTILYSLNPNDLDLLAVLTGSYQQAGLAGNMQLGAAWWFNDTFSGIRAQLTAVANNSLLGNFVGMLTDSRSFLSYTRHDYFRRILCDLVGQWIEKGMLAEDLEAWGGLVADVSYNNVKRYFFE